MISSSCITGNKENVNEIVNNNAVSQDKSEKGQIILVSDSGIILINIKDGKANFQTRKQANQTIYIKFSSNGYKQISANLSSPDSLANIRFSQIFLPDGTMDGPFGRDLEYQLPTDGLYKISIHENMMAGDPWAGLLNVEITLSKSH